MAFQAAFTASQSIDGKTLTFTDTSVYGGTDPKSSFTARVLIITRSDDVNTPTTYDFPYTGTPDNIQDTFSLSIGKDYAYSVTMKLTNLSGDITINNPVLTTQFIELNKLLMLNKIKPCDDNSSNLLDAITKTEIALLSATQRASTGDIFGAGQLLSYAWETTKKFG